MNDYRQNMKKCKKKNICIYIYIYITLNENAKQAKKKQRLHTRVTQFTTRVFAYT